MTINNSFNHPQVSSNLKSNSSNRINQPRSMAEQGAAANPSAFKKVKSKKIKSPVTEFKLQKAKESLFHGLNTSSSEDIENCHREVGVNLPELNES